MNLRQGITGAAAAALLLCFSACGPELPPDPGLIGEDLGLGLTLGQDVTAARDAAGSSGMDVKVQVLTRDELNRPNPYADQDGSHDQVLAAYNAYPDGGIAIPGVIYSGITELRCFLADPASSTIELMNGLAAQLTSDAVIAKLGEPETRSDDGSGDTHLMYRFRLPAEQSPTGESAVVELVTSHHPAGNCFAFSLALTPEQPAR